MSEKYLNKNYIIIIDATCLMHPRAKKVFLDKAEDIVKNNKIFIHRKEVQNLRELTKQIESNEASSAKAALKLFNLMQSSKIINETGNSKDNFVDGLINMLSGKSELKNNLCLITQNQDLSDDILNLKRRKSITFQESVLVLQIENNGRLLNLSSKEKDLNTAFPKARKVSKIVEEELKVTRIPREGSWVYLEKENSSIKLGKRIGDGKEGVIYETNYNNLVCKIFLDGSRTTLKLAKLKLMTSKELNDKGICWPKTIVYNSYLEFVGFAMPKANGVELYKIVNNKGGILDPPPGWEKKDLVNICIDLLNKIRILQERNVTIGNINLWDILVTNDKKTCLIDTDSYQVGNFPCPRGKLNFTAPEIQGKEFRKFLRTENHENFAIATLLFMILMLGQSPYAQQDGISSKERIINKEFPYPFGKEKSAGIPHGPWRFIWSHLSYRVKKAFFNTFRRKTKKRLNVEEWIYLLKGYRNDLNNQFVSNELYPQILKNIKTKN